MAKAELNSELIATVPGDMTIYSYDSETHEYISSSVEYLAIGVGIPANSSIDAPGKGKAGFAIYRDSDLASWTYIIDHRGETVYSTENGEAILVSSLGDYPQGTTTLIPSTPYDKWNGKEWVTDTTAQRDNNIQAANLKKSALIDSAMQSIGVIQLKLQAGRALTDSEKNQLNAVLDYIDAVTAIDTASVPNISWPVLPG